MAEVFLAMLEGIGGFEKLVVVKRIFPQFCGDDRFVRMFLEEARLAASIRHQNVVHIFDIGKDDDGYFIVMEYLSGESLAFVYEALRARGETLPAAIACRIGASVAAGLHCAHTATDVAGKPQPIVHRDVTPSNVVVCYNGVTKIVDFGIAKATANESHTRVGALKGKMSYLTPEQINGEEIDGRTDVFQLGVCLHEMLTGRRLFYAPTDEDRMVAILERPIPPPSEINPSVPRALDNVVLGALQRDRDERPQNADVLRRQLEAVLVEIKATTSEHDVGDWLRQTLPDRLQERLAIEREAATSRRSDQVRAVEPTVELAMVPDPEGSGSAPRTPTLATVVERKRTGETPVTGDPEVAANRGVRRRWLAVAGTAALLLAVGVGAFRLGASDGGPTAGKTADGAVAPVPTVTPLEPDTISIKVHALPADATILIDGVVVGHGNYSADYPRDGRIRVVTVSAPGYMTQELEVARRSIDEVIALIAAPRAIETAGGAMLDEPAPEAPEAEAEAENARRDSAEPAVRTRHHRKVKPIAPAPAAAPVPVPVKEAPRETDDWPRRRTDNLDPWKGR